MKWLYSFFLLKADLSFWGASSGLLPANPQDYEKEIIIEIIANAIQLLTSISAAIAVLYIILGGYQYIISSGNEEQISQAKKTITYAIIGFFMILLAKAFVVEFYNLLSPTLPIS